MTARELATYRKVIDYNVGPNTPPQDVVEILGELLTRLYDHDEDYEPAIQWAINFILEDRRPYEDQ